MNAFGTQVFTLEPGLGTKGRVIDMIQANGNEVNVEKTLEDIEGLLDDLKKSVESKKKSLRKSSKFSEIVSQHPFMSRILARNTIISFAL